MIQRGNVISDHYHDVGQLTPGSEAGRAIMSSSTSSIVITGYRYPPLHGVHTARHINTSQ